MFWKVSLANRRAKVWQHWSVFTARVDSDFCYSSMEVPRQIFDLNENNEIKELKNYKNNNHLCTFDIPQIILNPMCVGLNLSISTRSGCYDLFPREKISCTWGGTHNNYFNVTIQGFHWIQSLSSNGPILKVEQVRIVFCWLQTSHTLPTSTMSMSRSVQCECPLQLPWSWCSISVVLIRVLPLEQPLSSQPPFFFLTLPSWRILSPRGRQAGCWHGGYAEILCAPGACG